MPTLPGVYAAPSSPSITLGYLSEVLIDNKIEHEIFDMRFGYTLEELKKKIKEFKPDLIGFSIFTYHHDIPYDYAKSIKKDFPNIHILFGGPHASTVKSQILEESIADYGLIREGENAILSLCKGKKLSEIDSLIFREKGKVIQNQEGPFVDVTRLSFPKYEKFELNRYLRKQINIMTSRGCPYSCTYCSIKTTVGRQMRMRTPKHVAEEVKYWYDKDYRNLDFTDDNFAFDRERTLGICEEISKMNFKDLKISVCNGIRADKVDREVLTQMKKMGVSEISIGVDGGNNKVMKASKRGETVEQIDEAIKIACELDYIVNLFFIVGMPQETMEDVKESIKLALKYPVNNANFYNAVPFPGTELYDYIKKNKLFVVKDPDYLNDTAHFDDPIFTTSEFPLKERRKMLKMTKKAEKEILRRTFVRKLKKFGIISEISSHIIFYKPVYKTLQNLTYKSPSFKKALILLTEKFNLRRMESIR
tara:strand:+ start:1260 stop:2690 length:1431 start_codon:yes stop_codon:yes gene_type:complete